MNRKNLHHKLQNIFFIFKYMNFTTKAWYEETILSELELILYYL